jgi:hypothetical protein
MAGPAERILFVWIQCVTVLLNTSIQIMETEAVSVHLIQTQSSHGWSSEKPSLYSYLIWVYVTYAVEIALWNNVSICEHGFINTDINTVLYLLLYVIFSWVQGYFCDWWMNLNLVTGWMHTDVNFFLTFCR